MDLLLIRNYYSQGTNGRLYHNHILLCSTIELPWRENKKGLSCIPEGRYRLIKRYSRKFAWHLEVKDVLNRNLILFHPANNAVEELKGCIAPVTTLTGAGIGLRSRDAFTRLKNLVFEALYNKDAVWLIIKS